MKEFGGEAIGVGEKENNTELRRLDGDQLLVDPCLPTCLSRGLPSATSNQTRTTEQADVIGIQLGGAPSPLRAASPSGHEPLGL